MSDNKKEFNLNEEEIVIINEDNRCKCFRDFSEELILIFNELNVEKAIAVEMANDIIWSNNLAKWILLSSLNVLPSDFIIDKLAGEIWLISLSLKNNRPDYFNKDTDKIIAKKLFSNEKIVNSIFSCKEDIKLFSEHYLRLVEYLEKKLIIDVNQARFAMKLMIIEKLNNCDLNKNKISIILKKMNRNIEIDEILNDTSFHNNLNLILDYYEKEFTNKGTAIDTFLKNSWSNAPFDEKDVKKILLKSKHISIKYSDYYTNIADLEKNICLIACDFFDKSIANEFMRDMVLEKEFLEIALLLYDKKMSESDIIKKLAYLVYDVSKNLKLGRPNYCSANTDYECARRIFDNGRILPTIIAMSKYIYKYYNICNKVAFSLSKVLSDNDKFNPDFIWNISKSMIKEFDLDDVNNIDLIKRVIFRCMNDNTENKFYKSEAILFSESFKEAIDCYYSELKFK